VGERERINIKAATPFHLVSMTFYKRWTQEEIEFLKTHYLRIPKDELISTLGRSWSGIKEKAQKLGIASRYGIVRRKSLVKELTEVEKAYVAMALDCEGSIVPQIGPDYYGIRIRIPNTSKPLVDRIKEIIGDGQVYVHDKGRKKAMWSYVLTGLNPVYDLLKQISPYLIVKSRQAKVAMKFCESRFNNYGKVTEEEIKLLRDIKVRRDEPKEGG
jgi:hypothetical protein